MKISRGRFGLLYLIVLLVGAGIFGLNRFVTGSSAPEQSAASAAKIARENVEQARVGFEGILRSTNDPGKARREIAGWVGSIGYVSVTASRVDSGAVEVDLAAIGRADATDGFSHSSSLVRVCARLSGRPAADAVATASNLRCPDNAPLQVPSLGAVDETVPL